MAYNKKRFGIGPEEIYRPGIKPGNPYRPGWSILTQAIETAAPPATSYFELANYLYHIGIAVDMIYGYPISRIDNIANVTTFLKQIAGYKFVSVKTPSASMIHSMLTNGTPVYARGYAKIDDNKNNIIKTGDHAWVIDGYEVKQEIFPVANNPQGYITVDKYYFHCRYGYGGDHDGWFLFQYNNITDLTYSLQQIIYYTL